MEIEIISAHLFNFPVKYPYECVAIALVLIYISMYFQGVKNNKLIALGFANSTFEIFKNAFTHVGVSKQENGPLISAESGNIFRYLVDQTRFFASGRLNQEFALITLELKKRQDLLSLWLFSFFWPEKDLLQIDISLSSPVQPMCFVLAHKKRVKEYKENNIDLKYLTEKVIVDKIEENSSLIALAEAQETLKAIFDNAVSASLEKVRKHVQIIHLTDQKSLSGYPYHLRLVFEIPDASASVLQNIAQFSVQLADKIALYKLPAQLRAEFEGERQKLAEVKSQDEKLKRIEEAQKKKTEKILKEKQKLLTLSREQQLKIQEKEKKEEYRKKFQKKVMHM